MLQPVARSFSFSKKYKLCNKQAIEALYTATNKKFVHPLAVNYILSTFSDDAPFKLLIIVPKRNFKKAIDRNRIKRQLREIVRLHKTEIIAISKGQTTAWLLNYKSTKKEDFELLLHAFKKILTQLK
jgi:ribonuclease P protein component